MTTAISPKQPWHIQCLTQATSDTTPSFMVVFHDARYLFDAGENVTRAMVQDRISMKKLRSIFLSSSVQVQSTSGLGGLLLSMGEKDGAQVDVHGPEGTDHLLASMRYHTRRPKMRVNTHEYARPLSAPSGDGVNVVYSDQNIKVEAYPVLPDDTSSSKSAKRRPRSRSASPASKRPHNDTTSRAESESAADQDAQVAKVDWWGRSGRPDRLKGKQAAEWRKLVIEDMFRAGSPSKPAPTSSNPDRPYHFSSPAWNSSSLPDIEAPPFAVSYYVTGPPIRGRFKPEAAKAQGVTPGPDFAKLTKGEPVTLPDGKIILPETCTEAGANPSAFALVSCPSTSYIPRVIASPVGRARPDVCLLYVFHHIGPGVLHHSNYRKWLETFPASVQHVVSAPELGYDRITFASAAILQLRLSKLDEGVFRMPSYDSSPVRADTSITRLDMGTVFNLNTLAACDSSTRLRHFDMPSDTKEAEEAASRLNERNDESKAHAKDTWQEYKKLVAEAKTAIQEASATRTTDGFPGCDIKVTALGTGSAMPSKYRTVSATLLELPSGQSIMLDVGEGTYGQLARHFGASTGEALQRLSSIFISHMHADHHGGLSTLLYRRSQLTNASKLYIVCPPHVRTYIQDIDQLQSLEVRDNIVFIDANDCLHGRSGGSSLSELLSSLKLRKVETVLVQHRARCFGVVLEGVDDWKIVYSGDTQPCDALVAAGKNATLLIHEATIEDELPEVARYKGHSTFAEALDVAKRMQAKHCLLTHFSQRYPKFPPLADREVNNSCDVAVAFDLMSINIGDFWKAQYWTKPLQTLFTEWEGDDSADALDAAEASGPEKPTNAKESNKQKQKAKAKAKQKQSKTLDAPPETS